jgi:uncharacterized protein (TIGR02594 family)
MTTTRDVQRRLRVLGFDAVDVDGVTGPKTTQAVKSFQRANGLLADGIVGPKTRLALFPKVVAERMKPTLHEPMTLPPWLRFAVAEIGVKEVAGRGSNARILAYRALGKTTDDMATEDGSRPWCADFVNAMLELSGHHGTRSGMARSFERSADFVRLNGPALGAVVTYWRGTKASGKGHVNFYAGRLPNGRIVGVGGNQGDAVTAADYGASRLVGYWWPRALPLPAIGHAPAILRPTGREGREV